MDRKTQTNPHATPGNPQMHAQAVRKIRLALMARGSSLNAWATAHGYAPRTVYKTVATWAGRTDRAPHGGLSRSIMADLRQDLGADLVPLPTTSREAA